MAASITTQADVVEYGLITDNEIHRLSTERMRADNWLNLHERAWDWVLRMLELRASPLEESDLSAADQTALKPAVVYMVLHYAYAQNLTTEASARADLYQRRAIKELQEIKLEDGDAPTAAYDFMRARRAT